MRSSSRPRPEGRGPRTGSTSAASTSWRWRRRSGSRSSPCFGGSSAGGPPVARRGLLPQERDRLVLDNQLDPRRRRAWEVVDDFVAAQGPRVRLARTVLEHSTSEVARIDPVAEGAAAIEVLISDGDVLVSIGVGGRYELDIDDEDLLVLAALLEGVAAGRYVEDVRVGASRYATTLADGRIMKGSEQDLLWSMRWGRQHLTYQAY